MNATYANPTSTWPNTWNTGSPWNSTPWNFTPWNSAPGNSTPWNTGPWNQTPWNSFGIPPQWNGFNGGYGPNTWWNGPSYGFNTNPFFNPSFNTGFTPPITYPTPFGFQGATTPWSCNTTPFNTTPFNTFNNYPTPTYNTPFGSHNTYAPYGTGYTASAFNWQTPTFQQPYGYGATPFQHAPFASNNHYAFNPGYGFNTPYSGYPIPAYNAYSSPFGSPINGFNPNIGNTSWGWNTPSFNGVPNAQTFEPNAPVNPFGNHPGAHNVNGVPTPSTCAGREAA